MDENIDPNRFNNFYEAQCFLHSDIPYFLDSEFKNYVCSKSLCDNLLRKVNSAPCHAMLGSRAEPSRAEPSRAEPCRAT